MKEFTNYEKELDKILKELNLDEQFNLFNDEILSLYEENNNILNRLISKINKKENTEKILNLVNKIVDNNILGLHFNLKKIEIEKYLKQEIANQIINKLSKN